MARRAKGLPVNAEQLKYWRIRRGLTVDQLVERSGVSKRAVDRYEKGENALPRNLASIAEGLQIEVETLWADPEPPATEPDTNDPTAVYLAILEQNKSLSTELGVTQ